MDVEPKQSARNRSRLFTVTRRDLVTTSFIATGFVTTSGLVRRAFATSFVAGSLLLLAATTACSSLIPPGPTPVAQGKYYGSGNAQYDDFFLELYRSQVHVATLPERVSGSRNTLTDGLTVSRDLTTAAIVEHVRARAQDLEKQGVLMKLDAKKPNGGPATAVLLTRPATRSPTTRQLAEPVEKSSNELLALGTELETTNTRLERLDQRRAELLTNAWDTFEAEGPGKIGEVKRNLEDARQVLELMRTHVAQYRKDTSELFDGLSKAVDTSKGTFERAEAEPESEPEPKAKRQGAGKKPVRRFSGKGSTSTPPQATAPRPAPVPKASGSDGGFEP